MPKRIQRSRAKGWRMPPNTLYVGRPSYWGNPFRVSNGDCEHPDCGPKSHPPVTAQMAVDAFRRWIGPEYEEQVIDELRGKDLACWCPLDQPCHADVLLELANQPAAPSAPNRSGR